MRLEDAADQEGRRIAGLRGDAHDFTCQALEIARLAIGCCVPARRGYHNFRRQAREEPHRGFALDDGHEVDGRKSGQNFSAFRRRVEGARRGVPVLLREARANRFVAFDRNDQDVPEGARLFEEPRVSRMQQVETAARAHYSPPGVFPPTPEGNQFSLRNDLSQTSACRAARRRAADL